MKRTRIFSLVLIFALSLSLFSCGTKKTPDITSPDIATTAETKGTSDTQATTASTEVPSTEAPSTTATPVDPENCKHNFELTSVTEAAGPLTDGFGEYTCSVCQTKKTDKIPATKSIKILAVGNSFSVDAMEYLWDILHEAGIENIVLGNLYIGGCSLDTHYENSKTKAAAYTYYVNVNGKWTSMKTNLEFGITDEEWDIVTLQQASHDSGVLSTYSNLVPLIEYVKANVPEKTKIYWHMTWAYQQNSTHSGFANYNKDQMTMYNAIVKIASGNADKFDGVIPCGTTIQNLRTSYLGDTLTRDGYHMSYDYGRYATALTWAAKLVGIDIDKITWTPASYSYISDDFAIIREAVKNAVEKPFEVTKSTIEKEEPSGNLTDDDREILENLGYDPDKYIAVNLKFTLSAYYLSTSGSGLTSKSNSTAGNLEFFAATQIFRKSDLPNGTLIVVDDGYQYRPEGWVTLSSKNTAAERPANVSNECVEINSSWWGRFSYRAFNISYIGSKTKMTEEDLSHFHIYVPKEAVEEIKINPEDLKDTSKYTEMEIEFTVGAYYNSSTTTASSTLVTRENSTASNIPFFAATKIFDKNELPIGSVIVVDEGYQYRPEGWVSLGVYTAPRQDNVSENIVVVTDSWYGVYNYRAFNISYIGSKTVMTEDDTAHFRIYIPVK